MNTPKLEYHRVFCRAPNCRRSKAAISVIRNRFTNRSSSSLVIRCCSLSNRPTLTTDRPVRGRVQVAFSRSRQPALLAVTREVRLPESIDPLRGLKHECVGGCYGVVPRSTTQSAAFDARQSKAATASSRCSFFVSSILLWLMPRSD